MTQNKLDAANYYVELKQGKRVETFQLIRKLLAPMKQRTDRGLEGVDPYVGLLGELRMAPTVASLPIRDQERAKEIERETREVLGYFLDLDTITFSYKNNMLTVEMWDTKMLFLDAILKTHY